VFVGSARLAEVTGLKVIGEISDISSETAGKSGHVTARLAAVAYIVLLVVGAALCIVADPLARALHS
jgi:hypothetical protein